MKRILRTMTLLMVMLALLLTAGCASKSSKVVKIGHKNYTEQRLTGRLMAVYLESKGYKTEVFELAGTMLCFNALKSDQIDMYPEFTGSAYGAILDQSDILGVDETYNFVKSRFEDEYGITWLTPLGWNNTYVLSVTKETMEKYDLKTLSDVIPVSGEMVIGCDSEFVSRVDGLIGLMEAYPGLEFKDVMSMDQGLTYAALAGGDLDINASYSTDGRIAKYGLINLADDKNFFPPYYVTPILKMDYAEKNPEIVKALEELGNQWTEEELQKYNLMVDEGGDLKEVATMMLKDKGLIK